MYDFFLLTFALIGLHHVSNAIWLRKALFAFIGVFNLCVCLYLLRYSDMLAVQQLKQSALAVYTMLVFAGYMGIKISGLLLIGQFLDVGKRFPTYYFLLKSLVALYVLEWLFTAFYIWYGLALPSVETGLLRSLFILYLGLLLTKAYLDKDSRPYVNQILLVGCPYALCALLVIWFPDVQVTSVLNGLSISLFGGLFSVLVFATMVHRKTLIAFDARVMELTQSNKLFKKHIDDYKEAVDERTRELRAALKETEEKEQEIAHINQVVQIVNSTLNLDRVMESLMVSLQAVFHFDQIKIGMINDKERELVFYKAYGDGFSSEQIENLGAAKVSLADIKSIYVSPTTTHSYHYIPSVTTDIISQLSPSDQVIYRNSLSKSLLVFPLVIQGKTFGVIVFGDSKRHFELEEEDLYKIERYVLQIATAINNAHLSDRVTKAQAQLVQSEKMAGLGTLVAGVAHEINNPTNFVYGAAYHLDNNLKELKELIFNLAGDDADKEFIEMFEKRFEKMNRNLGNIQEGSERIKTIVNDLRNFSRLDEGEKKEVHVSEGILSTLHLIQTQYKKEVEFHCDFKEDPAIVCWPAQLNQVFMNIMSNACQAIVKKQSTEQLDSPGSLTITTYTAQGRLIIQFEDTGCGMEQDVKLKMFDPFFTTKGVGEGTGMGMSISYGIIERHDGKFEVESQPGVGTTIRLVLPIDLSKVN